MHRRGERDADLGVIWKLQAAAVGTAACFFFSKFRNATQAEIYFFIILKCSSVFGNVVNTREQVVRR